MPNSLETQLIHHLQEAHAMEENVSRMLDSLILTTNDPQLLADFKKHKTETSLHARRIESRLAAYDTSRSLVQDVVAVAGALLKGPIDMLRSEPTGRNIRDAYATEHAEIAAYELLERVAELAGDAETANVARANRADEEAMAARIEKRWDQATDQALKEAGVTVPDSHWAAAHSSVVTGRRPAGPKRKSSAAASPRKRATTAASGKRTAARTNGSKPSSGRKRATAGSRS